jgi:[histone H3]-lysine4 N-trimethyltransferase ATXR3
VFDRKAKTKNNSKSPLRRFLKYFDEKSVPEFYNIMLEKHKIDPDGYDVLFVDPIYKGHYGSRFSHSCDPNCGTVPVVANGKYTIAMYAMKVTKIRQFFN